MIGMHPGASSEQNRGFVMSGVFLLRDRSRGPEPAVRCRAAERVLDAADVQQRLRREKP